MTYHGCLFTGKEGSWITPTAISSRILSLQGVSIPSKDQEPRFLTTAVLVLAMFVTQERERKKSVQVCHKQDLNQLHVHSVYSPLPNYSTTNTLVIKCTPLLSAHYLLNACSLRDLNPYCINACAK